MSLRVFNRKLDGLVQPEAAQLLKELGNLKRRVAWSRPRPRRTTRGREPTRLPPRRAFREISAMVPPEMRQEPHVSFTQLDQYLRCVVVDLKTSARKSTDIQVEVSLQLSIYSYATTTERAR